MSESNPARDAALRGLVERGVITPAQAEEVRSALEAAAPAGGRVRWMEIAGYIGGGLFLAGAVALVATSWDVLSKDAQITLLAVLAAVTIGGAMFMSGGPHRMRGRRHRVSAIRRRIAGVLLALAAVLGALAVGIALDDGLVYVPFLVGAAIAAAGYAALPSAVGQVAVWGMAVGLVGTLVEEYLPDDDAQLAAGAAWLCLGLVWAVLASLGAAAERKLGMGLGAGLALWAAQFLLAWSDQGPWGYGATLAVSALCIAYYTWQRAAVLLVLGILGVSIGVPELVWDVTDGAIGAAAVLLLAGGVLLVASWLGIVLHRRRSRKQPTASAAPPAQGPPQAGPPAAGPPATGTPPAGPRPGA